MLAEIIVAVRTVARMSTKMLRAPGLAAAGILFCTGCAASDADRTAAEFRYLARDTYKAAQQESCRPSSVVYAVALADEIATLRDFEATMGSNGVGFQLSLARADVAHHGFGCWVDDDPVFAQRHVSMARERLTHGLDVMAERASTLPAAAPRDGLATATSAAFRDRVARLIQAVNPQCQLSVRGDNEEIVAPARTVLNTFRRRLDGSDYALHFDIAKADVLYELSVTMVECTPPRSRTPEPVRTAIEAEVRSGIEAIESGMGHP